MSMKIFQDNHRVIKFEFYDLDEPDELEITLDDDITETYINLTARQAKSLYRFLKSKYDQE